MKTMKTEPSEIDREAARLFDAAPGMVIWQNINGELAGPARVMNAGGGAKTPVCGWPWLPSMAFDIDDPATVGAMLAQVEGEKPGLSVTIVDRLNNLAHEPDRRFQAIVTGAEGWQNVHTGPTRGAVLVAAMLALKAAP